MPFSLGITLVKGSNGFKDYIEENLKNPDILAMARKVKVELNEGVDKTYPSKFGGRVTVKLGDDLSYQERVDNPSVSLANPMIKEECEEKFWGLASVGLPDS